MEQAWWKSSFPAGDGNLSFSPLQAVVSASLELPPAFSCGSATCWLPLSLARFCVLEEKKNSRNSKNYSSASTSTLTNHFFSLAHRG